MAEEFTVRRLLNTEENANLLEEENEPKEA